MVKPELFGSDDERDGDTSKKLAINKRFAKDFQLRKQREDLRNNPIFSGDEEEEGDEGDASTSSSEDEDGALLTTKLDTDIMKTINAVRSKDSRIYDPQVHFFPSDAGEESDNDEDDEVDKRRTKPKRYKDVVREQTLEQVERGIDGIDKDEDAVDDDSTRRSSHRLVYNEEQAEIRASFLKSTKRLGGGSDGSEDDGDGDNDDEGLLVVKKKPHRGDDENDEKEFMEQVQRIESTMQKDEKVDYYVDPKGEVDNGSKFLMNFFKNRAWIDKEDEDDRESDSEVGIGQRLKQNDEILPMKTTDGNDGNESDASLDHLDKVDDFEAQYNFRFEEAAASQSGADFSLISYARGQTVNTLRRKDESRREKRLARKERKAAERKAKEEELKRLKNLKRKEMDRKLKEVKKVVGLTAEDEKDAGGIDEAAIMKLIEGDYDPEEFERKMQEAFGDDFYGNEDKEWKNDKDMRESLLKDEDGRVLVGQDDDGDMYDAAGDEAEAEADEGVNGDEEDDWEGEDEEYYEEGEEAQDNEETEIERKIKSKMEDELYKLDYEDIVGGMPTRFKYRQVERNDYGLTTEEILFARDTTLKQFVSLKKMAPFREDGEYNPGGRRRRRFRDTVKHEIEEEFKDSEQVEPGEVEQEEEDTAVEGRTKKRKRRRSKKSKIAASAIEEKEDPDNNIKKSEDDSTNDNVIDGKAAEQGDGAEQKRKRRRRNKKSKSIVADGQLQEPDAISKATDSVSMEKKQKPKESSEFASDQVTDKDEANGGASKESSKDHQVPSAEKTTTSSSNKEKRQKKEKKHKHKHEKKEEKKHKKKKKKSRIEGISSSRLSSYGL